MENQQTSSNAIFQELRTIIYDKEFELAQRAFMEKNYDQFEDTEENKLIYTQIYEQFVSLLENIIIVKLELKFKSEDIDDFYTTFVDNMKQYEAEDAVTVNSLFSFIDFEKFKESILIYKKDRDNSDAALDQKTSLSIGSQDPEVLFQQLLSENIDDASSGWKFKAEKKLKAGFSFKLWSKVQDGGIDMSRVEYTLPGVSMAQIDEYFKKFKEMNKDPYIEKMDIFERDERGMPTLYYLITKIPMMTKRESIIRMKRTPKDEHIFYLLNTVEKDDIPRTTQFVRTDLFKGIRYTPQPDGSVNVVEFMQFNMGGYFPGSFLNMIQVTAVSDQLQSYFDGMKEIQV